MQEQIVLQSLVSSSAVSEETPQEVPQEAPQGDSQEVVAESPQVDEALGGAFEVPQVVLHLDPMGGFAVVGEAIFTLRYDQNSYLTVLRARLGTTTFGANFEYLRILAQALEYINTNEGHIRFIDQEVNTGNLTLDQLSPAEEDMLVAITSARGVVEILRLMFTSPNQFFAWLTPQLIGGLRLAERLSLQYLLERYVGVQTPARFRPSFLVDIPAGASEEVVEGSIGDAVGGVEAEAPEAPAPADLLVGEVASPAHLMQIAINALGLTRPTADLSTFRVLIRGLWFMVERGGELELLLAEQAAGVELRESQEQVIAQGGVYQGVFLMYRELFDTVESFRDWLSQHI